MRAFLHRIKVYNKCCTAACCSFSSVSQLLEVCTVASRSSVHLKFRNEAIIKMATGNCRAPCMFFYKNRDYRSLQTSGCFEWINSPKSEYLGKRRVSLKNELSLKSWQINTYERLWGKKVFATDACMFDFSALICWNHRAQDSANGYKDK